MKKTLWIGYGNSAQAWYRCGIPATELNSDWVGLMDGPPDNGGIVIAGNCMNMPNPLDYEVVIVQLAVGEDWLNSIKSWQKAGVTVYYECDDYLHGVNRIKDHKYQGAFNKKRLKQYVNCMKACDGMIVTTQPLADYYSKYNSNIHVCQNFINTGLYDVLPHEKPDDKLFIGWSGGTGHLQAVKSWYREILDVMTTFNNTAFMSIGTNYGDEISMAFPDRSISVPWTNIENYPYALRAIDIGIAPSHDSKYFRSKSDLRWIEGAAVGLPMVVNPITYPEVEDRVTGMVANDSEEFEAKISELVMNADLRNEIAQNAKKYVQDNRDIRQGAEQWRQILS